MKYQTRVGMAYNEWKKEKAVALFTTNSVKWYMYYMAWTGAYSSQQTDLKSQWCNAVSSILAADTQIFASLRPYHDETLVVARSPILRLLIT